MYPKELTVIDLSGIAVSKKILSKKYSETQKKANERKKKIFLRQKRFAIFGCREKSFHLIDES